MQVKYKCNAQILISKYCSDSIYSIVRSVSKLMGWLERVQFLD